MQKEPSNIIRQAAISGILAGILIAISTLAYLNIDNRIVGAVAFSMGLTVILSIKVLLYTGIVGKMESPTDIFDCAFVLLMNVVGCLFVVLIPTDCADIVDAKLSQSIFDTFVRACVCGVIIEATCMVFTRGISWIALLTVPVFILIGAEHSVADVCFMFAAREFSMRAFEYILVVAIGNAVGAIVLNAGYEKTLITLEEVDYEFFEDEQD